jgi:HEAT repeat protein
VLEIYGLENLMWFLNCSAARDSSNLLAHEAAFALGQMQDAEAIPALEAVLKDLSLHPIVRHEVVTST